MANRITRKKYNPLLIGRMNYFNNGGQAQAKAKGVDWGNPFKGQEFSKALNSGALNSAATAAGAMAGGAIGGGLQSGAGSVVSGLGSIASAIPGPWGAIAGAGLNILGGLTNRMFGSTLNKENITALENNNATLRNVVVDQSSTDALMNQFGEQNFGMGFDKEFIGKDGWFSNKAKKEFNRLKAVQENTRIGLENNYTNASFNVENNALGDQLANYAAFGGELGTNGADFSNGLVYIDNGGSHEENPYEGVRMGMDQEGIPNLVEEGEVIYDDYVFSNRLMVPKDMRNKYKLRGNKPLTFADAVKELSKESEEMPNDPISQRGLEAILSDLMTAQEEKRAERQSRQYAKGGRLGRRYEGDGSYTNFLKLPIPEWAAGYNGNIPTPSNFRDLRQVNPIEEIIRRKGLSPDQAALLRKASFPGTPVTPSTPAYTGKYGQDWYDRQARMLGISPEELQFRLLGNNDADNVAEFNRVATNYKRTQAENKWNADQRQSMFNKDLNEKVIRKATGDSNNYYIANTWDTSGSGWIDANWKYDPTNPTKGMLTDEAYNALSDTDKAKFKQRIFNAGDKVINYNGDISWGTDALTADQIKERYTPTGFKWDEKNNVNLELPDETGYNPLTSLRYAPALGAGLGIVTDLFGLTNKPDYTSVNDILTAGEAASRGGNEVSYNPIGNYLTYTPFDRDYYINQLNSQAGATRRNLLNTSAGNRGTAAAGLLAADFNYLNSMGNLARQAEEYNLAQRQAVEAFNRDTNKFNSQMQLKADMANQAARNSNRELRYRSGVSAAELRQKIDAQAAAGRSANLTNLFNSLGNIGREEVMKSWINGSPALDYLVSLAGKGTPYDGSHARGGYLTIKKKGRRKK